MLINVEALDDLVKWTCYLRYYQSARPKHVAKAGRLTKCRRWPSEEQTKVSWVHLCKAEIGNSVGARRRRWSQGK